MEMKWSGSRSLLFISGGKTPGNICLGDLMRPQSRSELFEKENYLVVLFYVWFVLCRSVCCLCVNVYCTTANG